MKPEKVVIKKHTKNGTRDESFPITKDSDYSVEKLDESESDVDEILLNDDTFEDSCDHHIQYLVDLAKVAQISFDKYTDERDEFKMQIDEYRELMIQKSALVDTMNDLKSDIAVLTKKISTSKKHKKNAGKTMRTAKSIMTSYFMKVSDHKKANAKTLLKTQKKLTKRKSVRNLNTS